MSRDSCTFRFPPRICSTGVFFNSKWMEEKLSTAEISVFFFTSGKDENNLQNCYTLREIGLSYNHIRDKLCYCHVQQHSQLTSPVTFNSTVSLQALSRSTAQSAYKPFLNITSYSLEKPPERPETSKNKRLKTRSAKNYPKTTLQQIRVK